MRLAPITLKQAIARVRAWHRHLDELQGGLFAVQVIEGSVCVGVGVAGNPARVWQGTGKFVISRVATQGFENACSMVYGALCRAGKALGYCEAWTYTLPHESGTSLRAAGFQDMGLTKGGEWARPSRSRSPAKHPEQKRRWMRKLAEPIEATPTPASSTAAAPEEVEEGARAIERRTLAARTKALYRPERRKPVAGA